MRNGSAEISFDHLKTDGIFSTSLMKYPENETALEVESLKTPYLLQGTTENYWTIKNVNGIHTRLQKGGGFVKWFVVGFFM